MDELKAMIAENLDELAKKINPEASQYSEGYKAGYELAMAQVLNMIDGKYGSVQNQRLFWTEGGNVKSARKRFQAQRTVN